MKTKKLPVLISNFIFGKDIKSIKRSLYELKDCSSSKLKDYEKILQYLVQTCCIFNFGANADAMAQIAKLMYPNCKSVCFTFATGQILNTRLKNQSR